MFSHEGYQALHEGVALLDRTAERGRLELRGNDRRAYLHGLLTNDIAALAPGTGCYAALLTPQGRMISDMRVSELGDRLMVDLPAATAEGVRQRLADFIFSEDVEVQDVGATFAQFGVYGPGAADLLARSLSSPASDGRPKAEATELDSMALDSNREFTFNEARVVAIRSDDYGVAGFETFVPASEAGRWADALRAAGAFDVAAETVEVTRVEAGRPAFGHDMDTTTIPLEAGIEDRGISLTKGCYVGQEIIIRVLHRGQGRVAKRLVGLIGAAADGPLLPGMRLEAGGREIGSLTSVADSPRLRRPIALGYVHRDFSEPGHVLDVRNGDDPVRTVTVVTTPFIQPAGE